MIVVQAIAFSQHKPLVLFALPTLRSYYGSGAYTVHVSMTALVCQLDYACLTPAFRVFDGHVSTRW